MNKKIIKNFVSMVRMFKKPKFFISIIVLILALVPFLVKNNNSGVEKITVIKSDIKQTVSVSGKTKPASSVDLGFEKSGKVSYISADVGGLVSKGQALVRLDSSELLANLEQSEANLNAEIAKLNEMKNGTRPEEVLVVQAEVKSAEDNLRNTTISLNEKINDAYTKSDDAIRNSIDQMFDNPRATNPNINIEINNFQLENDLNNSRVLIENILTKWKATNVLGSLEMIKAFLDNIALAVNSLSPNSSITQVTIDKYKNAVSLARTNINTSITNVLNAVSAQNSAQSALAIASRQMELKLSGSTEETIKAQEARVAQVKAQVSSSEAVINKNIIYSPINGLVVKQEAKIGEIINPNQTIVSVISSNNFEVEAYVPEINIGKVMIGDLVYMKMDAFPGESFLGKLIYIDPAETLIDNVPNFKLRIVFDKQDERIKSGLSVDIEIEVDKKIGVISVPRYAIEENDGKFYVNRLIGSKSEINEIKIGIQGDNSFTEIVSGLSEGEIITFKK
ncbi:MAG: efflux RND transporter periplasmic adaptor subunit [Candidatus Paceibacterota bacterium]|jgi:RND family efflux transporter MFP subunit